ncbi:MAG: GNAT family N-acetyltransferase [Fermentimonas sp.]|nr:GNAT family N-acetyltransferase [Fermentimonas sp.]
MHIERITQLDESIVVAFEKLMPELTGREEYPSFEELNKVIESDNVHLCVAFDDQEKVIGTITVILVRIPTGLKALIEDVIVDKEARGKGVGTALIWHAMQIARDKGAVKIDLTSHPRRIAANKLYQKLGFEKRESNVYRYYFEN